MKDTNHTERICVCCCRGGRFTASDGDGAVELTELFALSPKNPKQKIIKRVIALEGDFIKTLGYKNRYVRVPDGHLWIEGDHHGHSFDSNTFGPVSLGLLHGRASHIIWPPNRWQKIKPSVPPDRRPLLSWGGSTEDEDDDDDDDE
ncbi:hypothetical protein SRHO_G00118970 [Serrasalmus rhombeus]